MASTSSLAGSCSSTMGRIRNFFSLVRRRKKEREIAADDVVVLPVDFNYSTTKEVPRILWLSSVILRLRFVLRPLTLSFSFLVPLIFLEFVDIRVCTPGAGFKKDHYLRAKKSYPKIRFLLKIRPPEANFGTIFKSSVFLPLRT